MLALCSRAKQEEYLELFPALVDENVTDLNSSIKSGGAAESMA